MNTTAISVTQGTISGSDIEIIGCICPEVCLGQVYIDDSPYNFSSVVMSDNQAYQGGGFYILGATELLK